MLLETLSLQMLLINNASEKFSTQKNSKGPVEIFKSHYGVNIERHLATRRLSCNAHQYEKSIDLSIGHCRDLLVPLETYIPV